MEPLTEDTTDAMLALVRELEARGQLTLGTDFTLDDLSPRDFDAMLAEARRRVDFYTAFHNLEG